MSFVARIGSLLLVALSVACAAYEDRLIVRRTRGVVRLEGAREGRLVTVQREELTFSDCRVIDVSGAAGESGGREVWRITTVEPRAALSEVRYGETPAGYAQVTPQLGRAPVLRAGASYRAECLGRRWLSVPFQMPSTSAKAE